MSEKRLDIKEYMYGFLQEPTREKFIDLVFDGVGEQDSIDFKKIWIDPQKLSEIILGMANTGGGVIILGVDEKEDGTMEAVGLEEIVDKEKQHSKISKFLPNTVKFDILDFDFSGEAYSKIENKMYQIIVINSEDKDLPYMWDRDSNENQVGCVFIRKGTKTVKANSFELSELIGKKIRSMYAEGSRLALEEHLEQLKTLYEYVGVKENVIHKNILNIGQTLLERFQAISESLGEVERSKNPFYPEEDFEEFIANMIKKKKIKIERVLDLK